MDGAEGAFNGSGVDYSRPEQFQAAVLVHLNVLRRDMADLKLAVMGADGLESRVTALETRERTSRGIWQAARGWLQPLLGALAGGLAGWGTGHH